MFHSLDKRRIVLEGAGLASTDTGGIRAYFDVAFIDNNPPHRFTTFRTG
jgi:hypothetical protein